MSHLPLAEIEIRTIKNVNLKGGTVIDGFPSGGLTNSIASMCFMRSSKNDLVAILDSLAFPPLSVIYNGTPNFPARIYANEDLNIAFVVSELNLDQSLYYSVSKAILRWSKQNECELIITAGTISVEESKRSGMEPDKDSVYVVGSTQSAKEKLKKARVAREFNGSVSGIPALLLNEGAWTNFDVIVLLVESLKDVSEFRGAAAVSEKIMKLVPGLSCDINSLLGQAKAIERDLRKLRSEQKKPGLSLYR